MNEVNADRAEILQKLGGFIREVIGEDWASEVEIKLDTAFSDDLELESIEFVALAERVQNHYGEHIDFVSWLSNLELDQIIDLKVGEVVDFIERCR